MGMPVQTVSILVQQHKASPFQEPVVVFGRQHVHATLPQLNELIAAHGVQPHVVSADDQAKGTMPRFEGVNDHVLFCALGLRDVHALDYSAFEGADIVCDLNAPIAPALETAWVCQLDSTVTIAASMFASSFHRFAVASRWRARSLLCQSGSCGL